MASRGINKVILVGNLGQDPEVRFAPSGTAFANFTLATSESWKDKQTGEQKEKTEWHRVSIIGKLAEIAGEYLKKGSKVYVEGKLQTRKWQNQQGQDQYTTEVIIDGFSGTMQMLDSRQSGQQNTPAQQQGGQQAQNQGHNQQQGGFQQQNNQGGFQQQNNQQQAPVNQGGQQGGFQQQQQNNQQQGNDFDGDIPF